MERQSGYAEPRTQAYTMLQSAILLDRRPVCRRLKYMSRAAKLMLRTARADQSHAQRHLI
jgi:hypothetical protein